MQTWLKTLAFRLATIAVGVGLVAGPSVATAQTRSHIEKSANQRLSGDAFATFTGLSYDQCESRCLAEPQCQALEHYRGGRVLARQTQCKLFSSTGDARPNQYADVGYKRPGAGIGRKDTAEAKKKADDAKRKSDAEAKQQAESKASEQVRSAERERRAFDERRAFETRRADDDAGRARTASRPLTPPVGAPAPSSPTAESPPPTARFEPPPPPPPTPAPITRAPAPSQPAPSAPAPSAEARPKTRAIVRSDEKSAGGGAPPAEWDVVPVFYGTDRNRRDQAKRIAYGSDRARRMELGRALVTVPKSHQVPNVERPWAIKIPYLDVTIYQESEDPKRHFTLQELKSLSKDEFLRLVRERLAASNGYKDQALVLVHGYNNGFDDALYRTAQVAYDLKFDGAPFLYSWPAGGGITSYPYDRESAQQAEQYLTQFLEVVLKDTGAASVSIIAHSMGNQPLLQVLRYLKGNNPALAARINQVILAAPDVDRDAFEYLAGQIQGVGRGVTMYASANDVALGISKRFAGGIPRAGDVPDDLGPAVVRGIDTIDVTGLSTEYLALNHSAYAEKSALIQDIEMVLRTGERPPEKRFPLLERIKRDTGDYWRYPR